MLQLSDDLIKIVIELIDTSYQELNYDKAIECVAHLRNQSILEEEPVLFNKYMMTMKNKYENRKKSLWKRFVKYRGGSDGQTRLTLLCKDDFEDEMDDLNVTSQDALNFLEKKKDEVKVAVEPVKDDSDDDDLDDLI